MAPSARLAFSSLHMSAVYTLLLLWLSGQPCQSVLRPVREGGDSLSLCRSKARMPTLILAMSQGLARTAAKLRSDNCALWSCASCMSNHLPRVRGFHFLRQLHHWGDEIWVHEDFPGFLRVMTQYAEPEQRRRWVDLRTTCTYHSAPLAAIDERARAR